MDFAALCLKGQGHEFFASGFFHESVSPKPLSILLGPFWIFSEIRGDICSSRLTNDHQYQRHRTPAANFATSFTSVVDTGSKFATGVNNTDGKFAAGVNDTSGKLPSY